MKESIIKRLKLEDIPQLVSRLSDKKFNCCSFEDFWSSDELSLWLQDENDVCIGCFVEDNLIGFCLSHFASSINKVYLENVFVDEKYRRLGIATSMLSEVVRLYREKNPKKVLRFVAMVEKSNTPAVFTLEKEGFNVGDEMLWIQKNSDKEN